MLNLKGIPIHQGIAEGSVYIKLNPLQTVSTKYCSSIVPNHEIDAYLCSIKDLTQEFQDIHWKNHEISSSTTQQIIKLYVALLNDPVFTQKIPELIAYKKIPATHAILEKLSIIQDDFSKLKNEYFQSRFDDFKSIGYRIIEKLNGNIGFSNIKKPVILIAETISITELLNIPPKFVLGLLSSGGPTSHLAILAKNLGITTVFGLESEFNLIQSDDTIILDGYKGFVLVNPKDDIRQHYQELKQRYHAYAHNISQSAFKKSTTIDGYSFSVLANIGNIDDIELAHQYKADGIGLLRTETQMLAQEKLLDQETQRQFYDRFLAMVQMPVTIRTLDLGGDKRIKNASICPLREDNPFLGLRSTRIFVQNPKEFRTQIYALLSTNHSHTNIKILLPFITTIDDFLILKSYITDYYKEIHGSTAKCPIPVGMMLEIPSTIICLEDFIPYVDFVSIGTNDLLQYILATDRNNHHVRNYHQASHPAIFKLLFYISELCQKHNMPLSICGEMAKEPLYTRILLGLGISTLSMIPTSIPMVKYILSHSKMSECKELWDTVKLITRSEDIDDFLQQDLNNFLKLHDMYFDGNSIEILSNTSTLRNR